MLLVHIVLCSSILKYAILAPRFLMRNSLKTSRKAIDLMISNNRIKLKIEIYNFINIRLSDRLITFINDLWYKSVFSDLSHSFGQFTTMEQIGYAEAQGCVNICSWKRYIYIYIHIESSTIATNEISVFVDRGCVYRRLSLFSFYSAQFYWKYFLVVCA